MNLSSRGEFSTWHLGTEAWTNFACMESLDHIFNLLNSLLFWPSLNTWTHVMILSITRCSLTWEAIVICHSRVFQTRVEFYAWGTCLNRQNCIHSNYLFSWQWNHCCFHGYEYDCAWCAHDTVEWFVCNVVFAVQICISHKEKCSCLHRNSRAWLHAGLTWHFMRIVNYVIWRFITNSRECYVTVAIRPGWN